MENYLLRVLGNTGIIIALLAPVVAIAVASTPKPKWAPILLFVALFVLDWALNISPRLVTPPGEWANWNWQGKILEMTWPLVLVAVFPTFSSARIGLQTTAALGTWRVALILSVIYLILFLAFTLVTSNGHLNMPQDLATPVFQLTMPNLGEEFVYRGVLQSLLNEAFGRPWSLRGVRLGWGFPIVGVLFALGHGVWMDSHLHLQVAVGAMIFPFVIGLFLGWLRERAGNVWPGVFLHTVINGAAGLLG